jgi:plastocyanin
VSDEKNRQSLLLPVLIPLAALAAIGLVLFGFSRVLLQITATAAWVTALIAAVGIMAVASYVASRRAVGGGSLFSMVGGVAGIAMLTGGVALFAAERGEGGEGPGPPRVVIVAPAGAAETGFAKDAATAPAGEAFQVLFDNQDSQQHNVVIAASEEPDAEQFLREEPFVGPRKQEWEVEPLEEGSYFFFCEVHPTTMTGTLEAVPGAGGPDGGPPGGPLVVAEGQAFDKDRIALPAGAPTTITFENRDAGIPHNLAIYRDEAYTDPVFPPGEPFPGPARQTYEVPPLEPGTLYFRCDVHPTTMEGTVVVEGAGGEAPQEPTGGG